MTVHFACDRFLEDAAARGLAESTMRKYAQLTKQMTAFAESHRTVKLHDWNLGVAPVSSDLEGRPKILSQETREAKSVFPVRPRKQMGFRESGAQTEEPDRAAESDAPL